jgi:hypothetical protein
MEARADVEAEFESIKHRHSIATFAASVMFGCTSTPIEINAAFRSDVKLPAGGAGAPGVHTVAAQVCARAAAMTGR